MLREITDAGLEPRLTLLGRRYRLVRRSGTLGPAWGARRQRALRTASSVTPVALLADGRRTFWWFEERFYWEDEGLGERDVLALVREREARRRRRLERAHAALAGDAAGPRRLAIPRAVRLAVFERDGGRCAECGSDFELQYDHLIPVALGGSGSVENLQLLCADCNRRKGAALA
ncbi:MAG TPA: HNH endonuclease signature motif containing protein [Thermoleophilaceae bacterium]|nr:HNH endonuclease signature motif containing protein [Thermoleophilaceae bacterium]